MKRIIIGLIFTTCSFLGYSQVTAGDCNVATNICSNAAFAVDPNGFGLINELGDGWSTGLVTNPGTNPNVVAALGMPNSGCLMAGELNSTWMIINISSNGALEFSFGADGGTDCYDWIMWPYDAAACTNIIGDLLPPVACNWNGMCESFTGMAGGPNGSGLPPGGDQSNFEDAINVSCGDQYIVCFSNFSSVVTNVPLNFFGSASIACTTYNPISVNDTTICEGLCATLTATGGITYTWAPNPDLSATVGAVVTACPLAVGSYDYYVTGTGACGIGVDTATVTVVAPPSPTISPVLPVNPTDPAFLVIAATPGGTWSSNCGPCIDPVTGLFDPAIAGTGVWQICYTVGTAPCDSMDCIDIVVGCISPILDPIANVTACDSYILPIITGTNLSGNEAFFTGTGGTGTQYNAGDVITSTITLFIYDEVSPGSTCTDEIAGFTITINISPDAGLDNNTVLCNTATTLDVSTLLGGADPGGTWLETTATPSGQFNTGTTIFDPAGLSGGLYTFTYTVPGIAPCIPDVATFTVGIVSGPPTLTCPGNLTTSCSILDEPAYANLGDFQTAGGVANDPSGQLDPLSFLLLSEISDGNSCPEVVTRTYEIANACGLTATCSHTITINDLTAPAASNPTDLIVACPIDVPAPNILDVTDESDNCTAAPIVAHVSDVSDGNTCNSESITRTYSITDDCGNTIFVNQIITISAAVTNLNAGVDFDVCEGDSIILTAANANGAIITWNNGVVDGIAFVPPVGMNTYIVTADICTGLCVSADTLVVTVVPAPVVVFSGSNLSGCSPLGATFTNETVPAGELCVWNFGDGHTTTGCGMVSNTYAFAGSYDVSLTVTNLTGCSATTTYTDFVTAHPPALAQFRMDPTVTDIEDTEVNFFNESVHGDTLIWNFGDGSGLGYGENPTHLYPDNPNTYYTITLTAISEFGCIDSVQATLNIQDILLFYLPNSFTPDDDEFNQSFQPVFTSGFDPFDFSMLIFNRWGEVIFESHDVNAGWNGTYGSNGRSVEDGTYTWSIEFKETMTDKRHFVNGHVNVLR